MRVKPADSKAGRPKEFEWRAGSSRPSETPHLVAGRFKSLKHKWLSGRPKDKSQELQASEVNGQARSGSEREAAFQAKPCDRFANQARPAPEPRQGWDEAEAPVALTNRNGSASLKLADGSSHPATAARKAELQAEKEVREQAEKRAREKTDASLANETLEAAAKKARHQAEQELVEAAEKDRAAQIASSMRKELRQKSKLPSAAQVSHRSSDNAVDTSTDVRHPRLPALSTSGSYPPQNDRLEATAQHRSAASPPLDQQPLQTCSVPGNQKSVETANGKTADYLLSSQKDAGRAGPSLDGMGPLQASRHAVGALQDHANGCITRELQPPMQVAFIDGNDKQKLGELDLNQLNSFGDLWLIIRSAYSARLPKGDLKLIYKDLDNDLMQYQDEPWDHFKSVARSLFLAKRQNSVT